MSSTRPPSDPSSCAHHRNYRSDASDLSIRFGTGDWPGYRCERLLPGAMVPMCSPSFLKRHGPFRTPADLAHAALLHAEDRSTWRTGCSARAHGTCRTRSGRCSTTGSSLSAARANLGIALLRATLVERELANVERAKLFDVALNDGRDHYLRTREDGALPDAAERLAAWLRKMTGV
ncbi:LysR substrate-binding domain-containing protein [Burkholderia dolosa]|uniref:LysR substrate-binding domain-containing protein n=1 Tax=Burkholderia dolosa TaxID=152500 RepID=UPI0031FE3C4E